MDDRRLIFENVVVETPGQGQRLVETLRERPELAAFVRSIVIKPEAFSWPSAFFDLQQDELLRLCSALRAFDSPYVAFAPLRDGRRAPTSYPQTLRSCRLGEPFATAQGYDSEDDSEDEVLGVQGHEKTTQGYISLLNSLPNPLTSLKLSQLGDALLPATAPTTPFPLSHLTALLLDYITISPALLEWVASAPALARLQVWCVKGIASGDILALVQRIGGQLKEVMFKPKGGKQGTRLGNEIVLLTPNLERLTLGDKACDHELWNARLPASLVHLCVSLPQYHADARLALVSTEIRTRLHRLKSLEVYSALYFPPPVALSYPDKQHSETFALRELRLSHINSAPGELATLLATVGAGIYTLAAHHVAEDLSSLLDSLPSLRRLELGVNDYTTVERSASYLSSLDSPFLHYLRVHFTSAISLAHLTSTLPSLAALKTLELAGRFPDDLGTDWTSGKRVDELVEACRTEQVELRVNGRVVETFGDWWAALVGQTGREML
ncbi:hypothetical protein JCM10213v2_007595 [Rhodosporidiobolus nylandii]